MTLQAGPTGYPDEADDLTEANPAELRDIRITTTDPEISIRLGSHSKVSTSEPDTGSAMELVDQAASLIHQSRSLRSWFSLDQLFLPGVMGILVGLIALFGGGEDDPAENARRDGQGVEWWAWLVLASILAGLAYVIFSENSSRVRVIPKRRAEAREQSTKLLGGLLIAVVGVVAGALLQLFFG